MCVCVYIYIYIHIYIYIYIYIKYIYIESVEQSQNTAEVTLCDFQSCYLFATGALVLGAISHETRTTLVPPCWEEAQYQRN